VVCRFGQFIELSPAKYKSNYGATNAAPHRKGYPLKPFEIHDLFGEFIHGCVYYVVYRWVHEKIPHGDTKMMGRELMD
jgi:hypothetical protein